LKRGEIVSGTKTKSTVVVNKVRGSEWDKLVDALFLVASACEKMRSAYHASGLSVRLYVNTKGVSVRTKGNSPIGRDKPSGAIKIEYPPESINSVRFTLETLAEELIKGSVPGKARDLQRDEFQRGRK